MSNNTSVETPILTEAQAKVIKELVPNAPLIKEEGGGYTVSAQPASNPVVKESVIKIKEPEPSVTL